MTLTEQEPQQVVVRPQTGEELATDIAVLKKQQTALHQQIQSLVSRVARLDRDLITMGQRKNTR